MSLRRAAGRAQAGAHARGAAARDQGPAGPGGVAEREADLHPARGARAHRGAPRGGRQAHPAAVRLRHVARPQRRRHRRRVLRRPQDAGGAAPRARRRRSSAGQEVVLNESFNVVLARGSELTGEVVTLKEVLDDGTRALIVGRADEERVVELADALHRRAAARRRHRADGLRGRGCCSRSCPGPRSRSSCSKRCPTSPTTTSAASTARSSRSPTRSSCRSCTTSCSPSTSCPRRRASCSTARPAAARRSSPRRSPTRWPRRWPRSSGDKQARSYFLNIKGPELLNKYVGETERQIRLVFQRAREKSRGGLAGHRLLRRDGLDVPHPRHGHQLRHGVDDRAAAAGRDRRRRDAEERDRDRRVEPRRPHRPRHPASRPARREDQDRAARRGGGGADLRPLPHDRPAPRRRRGARRSAAATRRRPSRR